MCGIVGVVQGEDGRKPVPLDDLFAEIDAARAALPFDAIDRIATCTAHLDRVDGMLRGVRGIVTLAQDIGAGEVVRAAGDDVRREVEALEGRLDSGAYVVDDLAA